MSRARAMNMTANKTMRQTVSGMRTALAVASLLTLASGSGVAVAADVAVAGSAVADRAVGTADSARFLELAMQSSMMEIELGELAQRNAGTTGINALGSRLARDHRRIGKVLGLISQDRGVAVPLSLNGDQQSIVTSLGLKTGADFDAAYAERMVASHEKLIALFDEAAAGSDTDIAAFAKKALPLLREGKRLADVYREVTSRGRPPVQPQAQTVAQTS